jgi:hypothetical protein
MAMMVSSMGFCASGRSAAPWGRGLQPLHFKPRLHLAEETRLSRAAKPTLDKGGDQVVIQRLQQARGYSGRALVFKGETAAGSDPPVAAKRAALQRAGNLPDRRALRGGYLVNAVEQEDNPTLQGGALQGRQSGGQTFARQPALHVIP